MKLLVVNPFEGLPAMLETVLLDIGLVQVVTVSRETVLENLTDQVAILFHSENGSNGDLELIKKIKMQTMFDDTPLLVLHPDSCALTDENWSQAGASAMLQVPATGDTLLHTIGRLLRPEGAIETLNLDFFSAFSSATTHVFNTMMQMNLSRKNFYLKKDYKMFGFLSAIMGLSGIAEGSAVISIPKELAFKCIARMVEAPPTRLSIREIHDGMGEIINMISGQAKANLMQSEYAFELSLPTVVVGMGHEIIHKEGTPCIVTIFTTEEDESLALQVSLASGNPSRTDTGRE